MKILRKIILIVLILGMFWVLRDVYKEDNVRLLESSLKDDNSENNIDTSFINTTEINVEKNFSVNNYIFEKTENVIVSNNEDTIPEKHLGFVVDGELEIPKINLKTYVFKEYSEEAMDICPTKLWGPNPNNYGNYSIIGHNYQKENMFNNLIELKIGDEIFFTDNKNGKFQYIIRDIYKVKENNIDPIKQNSKKSIELTLITCVNYTNNRLIIKAQKK